MKRILAGLLCLVFLILPLVGCEDKEMEGDLNVLFMQTGKSDCILLRTASATILVDTGYESNYETVRTTLNQEGVTEIDHLILTHFDEDHIGGAVRLLGNIPVSHIYLPDYRGLGSEYAALAEKLENFRGTCHTITEDTTLSPDGFQIRINPTKLSLSDEDDNNHSLIVSVEKGSFGMLLMGDALKDRVQEYAAIDNSHYGVVKLPHHGDYFKALGTYLGEVKPDRVVNCCEKEDLEEKLVTLCQNMSTEMFNTFDGNIRLVYHTKGDTYEMTQD